MDAQGYFERGRARRLAGDLQGAIADFGEAIAVASGDDEKVPYYIERGRARQQAGDLPGAIEDFGEATVAASDDHEKALYYIERGFIKQQAGDLPGAIEDFGEAIAAAAGDWKAFCYSERGRARQQAGDLQGAIADFGEAIAAASDDDEKAFCYGERGRARQQAEDLPGAIEDFGEAAAAASGNEKARYHSERGGARLLAGNLPEAIEDFDEANRRNPRRSVFDFNCYIAKKTESLAGPQRTNVYQLHKIVREILGAARLKKDEDLKPMHYTSCETLRSIAKGDPFRLGDAAGMDDDNEGMAFLDWLGIKDRSTKDILRRLIRDRGNDAGRVYLGSFAESHEDVGDYMMWLTYGKQGQGCAFVFETSYYSGSIIGPEGSPEAMDREMTDAELSFYRVYYRKSDMAPKLQELGAKLSELVPELEENRDLRELVKMLLDYVRFLFKSRMYDREGEVRLIVWRGANSGAIKHELDRSFIECPGHFMPKTALLGPALKNPGKVREWAEKEWAEKQGSSIEIRSVSQELEDSEDEDKED